MIKRLLIANRGEIACRIMGSASQLSIETIAIYSIPDEHSQHVKRADQAWPLDGYTAQETYLSYEKILSIAKQANACAIHPGYGFLSEDGEFAQAVIDAGFIFVGPTADVILKMGNKETAKSLATASGVPISPDYTGNTESEAAVHEAAQAVGFPLLVKASAGGGGKGMRLVTEPASLMTEIASAKREAQASFGNDSVFLERFIKPARHIEVQVARDTHGHCVHLYTRECSIQRRHQKIIEEAPALISADLSEAMCSAAVQMCHQIDYIGLGTVEFLVDSDHAFYFMEMNTRLQVEHPVTEMITGVDCVEWQLLIANGDPIPVTQPNLSANGHAIEARICAEDCLNDYLPSTGVITHLQSKSHDCRFDTGFVSGDIISCYYDSMIAKLITHASTRDEAVKRIQSGLNQLHIAGPITNVSFLRTLVQTQAYEKGLDITTDFIKQNFDTIQTHLTQLSTEDLVVCAALALHYQQTLGNLTSSASPWSTRDCYRIQGPQSFDLPIEINGEPHTLSLINEFPCFVLQHESADTTFSFEAIDKNRILIESKQASMEAAYYRINQGLHTEYCNRCFQITLSNREDSTIHNEEMTPTLVSPMPGIITALSCSEGDVVEAGKTLASMEAMKMEHNIRAASRSRITKIHIKPGQPVQEGDLLIELTAETKAKLNPEKH